MNQIYLKQVGSFECEVVPPEAGWFGESKEKLTPFIRVPVVVTEGPCTGQVAVWSGWLSNNAFDNTISRLAEAFGFDGDLAALNSGKVTLAGKPCNITTEIETYEGKEKCKVAFLNPPGGGKAKPMDAAKVNALLSTLTARAKAVAKSAKAAAPATSKPAPTIPNQDAVAAGNYAPAQEEDSDVPF